MLDWNDEQDSNAYSIAKAIVIAIVLGAFPVVLYYAAAHILTILRAGPEPVVVAGFVAITLAAFAAWARLH